MYLILTANKVFFSGIVHKFPVKGHTFFSCDRDFALIEKRKRVCKAYTLNDIAEVITSAANKNPVIVTIFEEFYDFRGIAQTFLNTKKLGISSSTQLPLQLQNSVKYKLLKVLVTWVYGVKESIY
jgi:hypothetical protein